MVLGILEKEFVICFVNGIILIVIVMFVDIEI